MGSLKDNSSSFWGSRFHQDLLTIFDTVVIFTLGGILREDFIHNFIFISSVEILGSDRLLNLYSVNVIIFNDGKAEESCDDNKLSDLHLFKLLYFNILSLQNNHQ